MNRDKIKEKIIVAGLDKYLSAKDDNLFYNGIKLDKKCFQITMIQGAVENGTDEEATRDEIMEAIKELVAESADMSAEEKEKRSEEVKTKVSAAKPRTWRSDLDYDDKGKILKKIENVEIWMDNDRRFKDMFNYNGFTSLENYGSEPIKDYNITQWRVMCEKELGFNTKDLIEAAVQDLAHKHTFNPFIDVIDNLVWDGQERMSTYYTTFLGEKYAEHHEYNKEVSSKWWYALIKRLYEPGCLFDNMLITYDSKQGTGKSKLVERIPKALGIDYGYCSTISCDNMDKDNVDKMNSTWIVGIDEMTEFLKANPEKTKQFLAQCQDKARLSYNKRSETFYRHCVFYGTTNVEYFLKDYTSEFERRYWIIECDGDPNRTGQWWNENLTDEYIRQVVAEAYYLYRTQPDYDYMTLSMESREILKDIQYRHKTLQNDDVLIEQLDTLLNAYYDKTEFVSLGDFEATIERCQYAALKTTPTTADFLGIQISDEKYKQIYKIPTTLLKEYIKKHFSRELSTQYINALLYQRWIKRVERYNNKATNCWCRIQ